MAGPMAPAAGFGTGGDVAIPLEAAGRRPAEPVRYTTFTASA